MKKKKKRKRRVNEPGATATVPVAVRGGDYKEVLPLEVSSPLLTQGSWKRRCWWASHLTRLTSWSLTRPRKSLRSSHS